MVAAYEQGYDAQAKQATRFLGRGADILACRADLSQFLTDMTGAATNISEATSVRFSYYGARTVGIRVSMVSANTRTLYRHGTGASTERFEFSAANTLRIAVNNAAVVTLAVTAPTGTDTCVAAWVSEPNPDTTGAGNAMRSRILHWNVTDGTFAASDWTTHAVNTSSSTTAVYGADDAAGAAAFAGTITAVWYEARAQTGAEIANDWVATRTAPTTVLAAAHQGHPPAADLLDLVNHRAGPSILWAGDSTRRCIRRTLSPVWNECLNSQTEWREGAAPDLNASPFVRGVPGALEWRLILGLTRLVPVTDTCNALWVRVHVRSYTSGVAASVPIGVRMYSWNRIPGAAIPVEDQALDPLESYFVGTTITRDDDTSAGQYTVLGLLPIARGRTGVYRGKTVLALALNIDPAAASGNDAAARIIVRAMHVVPAFSEIAGGLPFGQVSP